MCGIIGYAGGREAARLLLEGLYRLEYRGYDSAGLAVLTPGGKLGILRVAGKINQLERKLASCPLPGLSGVGHTRWATHGSPSEQNAHPHRSGPVVVVHNGILENHAELRRSLERRGRCFASETDSEVFAHLICQELVGRPLEDAVSRALRKAKGSYALVVASESQPGVLVGVRQASPLVAGLGRGENFLASDISALLSHTRRVLFLEDGELAVVTSGAVKLRTLAGEQVRRIPRNIDWSPAMAEKGGHRHFMHKEIFEQPRALADTLSGRIRAHSSRVQLDDLALGEGAARRLRRLVILACGTSWHAGLVGKFLIERLAHLPVEVDVASEFRYRPPLVGRGDLLVAVSQSGETADTLAGVVEARKLGARVLSICNVVESSIPRASHHVLYTRAGPEIGVASTKAFVTQIAALHLLAVWLGQARGVLSRTGARRELEALAGAPQLLERTLRLECKIREVAREFARSRGFLFIARGINYPIAMEGALKLKEISYIHAEAYPAGEMKHGPIALIDENLPVVAVATRNSSHLKILSNLAEVRARQGRLIAICSPRDAAVKKLAEHPLCVPPAAETIEPLVNVVPLQLLAYHVADFNGTDIDQPRNLAKSVTVE